MVLTALRVSSEEEGKAGVTLKHSVGSGKYLGGLRGGESRQLKFFDSIAENALKRVEKAEGFFLSQGILCIKIIKKTKKKKNLCTAASPALKYLPEPHFCPRHSSGAISSCCR